MLRRQPPGLGQGRSDSADFQTLRCHILNPVVKRLLDSTHRRAVQRFIFDNGVDSQARSSYLACRVILDGGRSIIVASR